MNDKAQAATQKLADNVFLTVVARFAMLFTAIILGPLIVYGVINASAALQANKSLIDKHEVRLEMLERDLKAVRELRAQELATLTSSLTSISTRLAQIETAAAVLTATINQQGRESDRRIEDLAKYLETRLGIKPPR